MQLKKIKQYKSFKKFQAVYFFYWFIASLLVLEPSVLAASNCKNTTDSSSLKNCVQNNVIVQRLQEIITVLSIGVGVVIVAMLILGGIQYITAGTSPEAVTKAKQRITNAIIALFAFLLTFAFLQWLVPGGIF